MLRRFRDSSLLKQLLLPMIFVGILGIGAVILSAVALKDSVVSLERLYSASGERLKSLQEIDRDIAVLRAMSLRHQANESSAMMGKIATDMRATRREIESSIGKLLAGNADAAGAAADDREALALLKAASGRYFIDIEEVLQLSADFEKELAFSQLSHSESENLVQIQASLQTLTFHAFEDMAVSRANLVQAAKSNVMMTILTSMLGGMALLGIALYVVRRASRRLGALLGWSRRIEAGDLNNILPADASDEVGRLTSAMGSMVRNLAQGREDLERARKHAEASAEELKLYAQAFESSGEPMLITDSHNRIINVNDAFFLQTEYTLDEVRGKNPRLLSSGNTPAAVYQDMWRALQVDSYWQGELWDRKKSGAVYPKWTSISAIRDADRNISFYIASFSDISERKANEARIDYLAHHDALTGLINRYNLENRLDQTLSAAQRENLGAAVMFIDMDRFKTINDTLGHHVGDLLLIEIARRLKESVRDSDIVARLGGDEFVVVLTGLVSDMDAAPVAEKILRYLGQPYTIENHQLHSSPSIGIAIFPSDGDDGETLMKNADTAMYYAKDRGRNNVQYFTASLNAAASERLALETDLRQALREGGLEVHYQPQVCAIDHRACGVEALVRWRHPVRGNIPPLKFIPIAEESGFIEELGRWVLNEACRQMAAWKAAGITGLHMAVNLSAKQLRAPDLVGEVAGILQTHGLRGEDLEIEVTESVAMDNPERAISQLQALKNLGVQLAIDDFGTGYSSLAYLKRLPIHVLKLDRAFVRDIETDESDAEISAATLALAHNLGLKVVAEGVETEGQCDFLVRHACDYLQGYLFSKPLPAEEAFRFIQDSLSET